MVFSLPSRKTNNLWIALIPFVLVFVYGFVGSLNFPLHDFANSYFAAYLFLHGPWGLSIFDPGMFNQTVHNAGFHSQFLSFNPFPPSTVLFFAPFVYFPPFIAKGIWNVGGMLLFTVSLLRLTRLLNISLFYLAIIPFVFWKPIFNNLIYGQSYLILFALLSEGYIALLKNKPGQSGLCWSLAIFLKIFPAALLLYLVITREWKVFACLLIALGLCFGVCLFFQGTEIWMYFFKEVLVKSFSGQVTLPFVIQYQSFMSFFQVAFVKNNVHNSSPLVDSPLLAFYFTQLVKILLLVSTTISVSRSTRKHSFGIFVLFMLLFLPYGSTYSLVLLTFTFLGLVSDEENKNLWIPTALIGFISNVGIHHFDHLPDWCQFPRLLGLSVLFVSLVISHIPKPNIYWLTILLVPLILIAVNPDFEYFIKETEWKAQNEHSLILELSNEKGKLVYSYWGPNGIQYVKLDENVTNSPDLKIVNNQIFFHNVQKTTSLSQKKCPLLLNDKIVYLSDYQKGIGFYSIWSVPIH